MHELGKSNKGKVSVLFHKTHRAYIVSEFGEIIDKIPAVLVEGTQVAAEQDQIEHKLAAAYTEPEGSGPLTKMQRRHNAYARAGLISESA